MNVNVKAGTVTGEDLQIWLSENGDNSLQSWLARRRGANIHALIEYVHRFAFVDWAGFLEDLREAQIAELCLRGRIFWETGQIAWRRLDSSRCSLCVILEESIPFLLPSTRFQAAKPFPEKIAGSEDSNLILWGTYNPKEEAFLERRVAGSRPLQYPEVISSAGRTYPILEVRTYFDEKGEPVLWRFLRPDARDLKDWPELKEEEA